jgi:hypothetical protein
VADHLLDRQVRLLDYLTSAAAIFSDDGDAPVDWPVRRSDRDFLRLQARLSHDKRVGKIRAVLPRTFTLLGDFREVIVREFTNAQPPTDAGFIENARQFCDFIWRRREYEPLKPPYLGEVAACELGLAEAMAFAEDRRHAPQTDKPDPGNSIRRRSGVVLLRCAYDVRSIFTKAATETGPTERDTRLVIIMQGGAEQPEILEVGAAIFDLLSIIDDWCQFSTLDRASDFAALIDDLEKRGLIDVQY